MSSMNNLVFLNPNTQELFLDLEADVIDNPPIEYRVKNIEHPLGYVYVVENPETCKCKIGQSINPAKRTRAVQTQAGIISGRTYISTPVSNPHKCEKSAHKMLSEFLYSGEWFSCSFDKAVEVVEQSILENGRFEKRYSAIQIPYKVCDDITNWFLSDSPELLQWFHKNKLKIKLSDTNRPVVFWCEDGEIQEISFDLFAALITRENLLHNSEK